MCEYCEDRGWHPLAEKTDDAGNTEMDMSVKRGSDGSWRLEYADYYPEEMDNGNDVYVYGMREVELFVPISFCPMCGRKLDGE